jgi:putative DNA primase/helicase
MGTSKDKSSHDQPVTVSEFLLAFVGEGDPVRMRAIEPDKKNSTIKVVATPKQLASQHALQDRLCKLNETRGLYFVVNSGGDKDRDISKFNAVFCESDNLSLEEQHTQLDASPLLPSLRVETKKSVHAYWLLEDGCSESDWREIQLGLISRFNSDPAIKNPARTMRLPGFNHISVNENAELQYKRVHIIEFHPDRRYTPAQLKAAFPRPAAPEARGMNGRDRASAPGEFLLEGSRNRTLTSLAGTMRRRGMTENAILAALQAENAERCNPSLDDLELRSIARSVSNYPSSEGQNDDALDALRALGEDSTIPEVAAALREMSAMLNDADRLTRQAMREEAIKLLKACGVVSSPAKFVDAAMPSDDSVTKNAPTALMLCDPEPWPEPVNGATLLDEIATAITRFVRAPRELIVTVALWVAYSHAFDSFECLPLLLITSPEKRCGKTTLVGVLWALVPRPLSASNLTPAVLFRGIEKYRPTLLMDEADTFLRGAGDDNKELRGIINSGHTRLSASVLRAVPAGDDYDVRPFSTWAPKVIAMIGEPADTIEDRSVRARLERKGVGEQTEHLRMDRLRELEPIRSRTARWAIDNADRLRDAEPDVPNVITNSRARDNWRVLLAVADAAGGDWPERAREIAILAAGRSARSDSARVTLLADMQALFKEHGDQLESSRVVEYLTKMEERPWGEWGRGKPLTMIGLARLLKPFGITPDKWREADETVRGYQLKDFQEAFARYVPEEEEIPPIAGTI